MMMVNTTYSIHNIFRKKLLQIHTTGTMQSDGNTIYQLLTTTNYICASFSNMYIFFLDFILRLHCISISTTASSAVYVFQLLSRHHKSIWLEQMKVVRSKKENGYRHFSSATPLILPPSIYFISIIYNMYKKGELIYSKTYLGRSFIPRHIYNSQQFLATLKCNKPNKG